MRKAIFVIWILVLATTQCLGQVRAKHDGNSDDAVRQIKAITREFVEGFNSGDLNRVMRAYADNYIDVNLRRPRQTNAERREYYQKIITSGKVKVEVIPDEIIITGKHAIVRGTILLSRTEAGNEKPRELRYIEVFQKFSNGWKSIWGIDADIYPDQD